MATPLFQPVPSVMFVGADDMFALECTLALPDLSHLRVAHAAAAVERMVVTRPLVVIVDDSVTGPSLEQVIDCSRDIRAEVLRVSSALRENLATMLRAAVLVAEKSRTASSGDPE
jgi:hypothetical protein